MSVLDITRVGLVVTPPDGGMAHFSVERSGRIDGGHHPGGPAPFVHIDQGELPEEVVDIIWDAAEMVDRGGLLDASAPEGPGQVKIEITYDGGDTIKKALWKFGEEPGDADLNRLSELLHEHRIGGW